MTDSDHTYFGVVRLEGLSESDAEQVLSALEGAIELEPDDTRPESWGVTGPNAEDPRGGS